MVLYTTENHRIQRHEDIAAYIDVMDDARTVEGRTYTISDYHPKYAPSVTTLMDSGNTLMGWYARKAAEKAHDLHKDGVKRTKKAFVAVAQAAPVVEAKHAADIGTEIHALAWHLYAYRRRYADGMTQDKVDAWIADRTDNIQIQRALRAWYDFLPVLDSLTLVGSEYKFVYDCPLIGWPDFSYAGTVDGVFRDDDGRLFIIDIKTGRMYGYNENAYQLGAYAKALDADHATIVHLNKYTGDFDLIDINIEEAFDGFIARALARLYDAKQFRYYTLL